MTDYLNELYYDILIFMHEPKIFSFREVQQWHESCRNQPKESTANNMSQHTEC